MGGRRIEISIGHGVFADAVDGVTRNAFGFDFAMESVFFRDLFEFVEDDAHDFSFFSERHESGLEPVDDESFDFIVSEVEDLARELEFIGHRRIGDESIVGVERATEPEIHVELERMVFDGIDGASLDIALEADFERDSVIVEVVEEIAVFA